MKKHPYPCERAVKALDFIIRYKQDFDGNSPSLREIGQAVGTRSTSYTSFLLKELERFGKIRFPSDGRRLIMVTGSEWKAPEGGAVDCER